MQLSVHDLFFHSLFQENYLQVDRKGVLEALGLLPHANDKLPTRDNVVRLTVTTTLTTTTAATTTTTYRVTIIALHDNVLLNVSILKCLITTIKKQLHRIMKSIR